jgi:hypothetical protein
VEYDGGITLGGEVQRRWGRRCGGTGVERGREVECDLGKKILGI